MAENTKASLQISLQDVVSAAAEGALRAIDARRLGPKVLIESGFTVDIRIRAGGIRALNPQPLPPKDIGG